MKENVESLRADSNKIDTNVRLFYGDKSKFPELTKLTRENRLKFLANTLEIQDYKKNVCKNFDEFTRIYLKIEQNIEISDKELLQFQASLTVYKFEPAIWKILANDEKYNRTRSVLMKALLLYETKNNVGKVITLDPKEIDKTNTINSKEFDKLDREYIEKSYKNNDIDTRANPNYARNIGFTEDLNMPANHINLVYDFADETELMYRTGMRSVEQARFGTGKELKSNHLLRVNRIDLGIMTEAWQNLAKFSDEDQTELTLRQECSLEIAKDCLLDIAHDIIEDGFMNKTELYNFLYRISVKYVSPAIGDDIATEISNSADRLNSHNFHIIKDDQEKESPRDYNVYLNGGTMNYSDGTSQEFAPLTYRERKTKISDMIHNWQTSISKNNKPKIREYLCFIADNIEYVEMLRYDLINNIMTKNLSVILEFLNEDREAITIIHKRLSQGLKDKSQTK